MPKIVDHDLRRAAILVDAFPVFRDQGYAAVSMRGLAATCGVSTGTLYHYFPCKDALFSSLVRARLRWDLGDATAGFGGRDHAERFEFAVQSGPFHAHKLRSFRDIAAEPIDLGKQVFAFKRLARLAQGHGGEGARQDNAALFGGFVVFGRDLAHADLTCAVTEDEDAFDDIS